MKLQQFIGELFEDEGEGPVPVLPPVGQKGLPLPPFQLGGIGLDKGEPEAEIGLRKTCLGLDPVVAELLFDPLSRVGAQRGLPGGLHPQDAVTLHLRQDLFAQALPHSRPVQSGIDPTVPPGDGYQRLPVGRPPQVLRYRHGHLVKLLHIDPPDRLLQTLEKVKLQPLLHPAEAGEILDELLHPQIGELSGKILKSPTYRSLLFG